jgi:hypothetical protein
MQYTQAQFEAMNQVRAFLEKANKVWLEARIPANSQTVEVAQAISLALAHLPRT